MNSTRRTIQAVGLVLVLAGVIIPVQGADWKVGDVFVAVADGQYQVYRVTGTTATLIDTINDTLGSGFTTGCAFDSTYHLFTTNFSNTDVVKFSISDPHGVLQTIPTGDPSNSADSESIVFDGSGNFYVGHADSIVDGEIVEGGGKVEKYSPNGTFVRAFAPLVGPRGTDWIELASDQKTLFYTSEGRIIRRFDVSGSGTQLPNFGSLGELSGTLFALRLLPPGDGSGGLLVAGENHIRRFGASGSVIQSYTAPGENFWFALNLDPNGTSFWAGDIGTGHLYRFNIASGVKEVGPITTSASPGDLAGICVYGGFGAAQPPTTVQTLHLTPGNPTGTVRNDNNSNALTVTLRGLLEAADVTVRFSEINPASGFSDDPLPCIIVSSDGTQCGVYNIETTTSSYDSVHLYHGWVRKGTQNPRMFRNGIDDITTAQYIDPGEDADTPALSTYTDHEAPLPSSVICSFSPPNDASFIFGSTIPVQFKAAATMANCSEGPFITDAVPRLSLAQKAEGLPPVPQSVGDTNLFTLSDDGRTWVFNLSTSNLSTGDYILTMFDLTDKVPPKSVTIHLSSD